MRCARARFSFGLRIGGGDEQAEAEVAGKAEGERAADRRGEAHFEQAPEGILTWLLWQDRSCRIPDSCAGSLRCTPRRRHASLDLGKGPPMSFEAPSERSQAR